MGQDCAQWDGGLIRKLFRQRYGRRVGAAIATVLAASLAAQNGHAGLEEGVEALRRADYPAALEALRPEAEAGRPQAQFYLGVLYKNGWAVAKDEAAALRWWQRAAEQGLADAQYNLGLAYRRGEGTNANFREAARWLSRAAQQGDPSAECALGHSHYAGLGVPQNLEAAARWFRLAARDGEAVCQHNLGLLYLRGEGVPVDYARAYAWFARAASQGHRDKGRRVDSAKNRDWVVRHLSQEQLARARALAQHDPEVDDPPQAETGRALAVGSPVARVQTALVYLGYERGPADGHLGEATREAIRRFQRERGMPVTGEVSRELLEAIERASPVVLDPGTGGERRADRAGPTPAGQSAAGVPVPTGAPTARGLRAGPAALADNLGPAAPQLRRRPARLPRRPAGR